MKTMVIAMALTIVCCTNCAGQNKPADIQAKCRAVLDARDLNIAKLTSANIVWSVVFEDGEGNVLRKAKHDMAYRAKMKSLITLTSQRSSELDEFDVTRNHRKVFDGEDFFVVNNSSDAKKVGVTESATFAAHEDYQYSIWWKSSKGSISMTGLALAGGELKVDDCQFDGNLVEIQLSGPDGTCVEVFDRTKGTCLVKSETRDPKGRLDRIRKAEVAQVCDGVWMPIFLDDVGFGGGVKIARNYLEVDRRKSRFNDVRAVPDERFEVPISPNKLVIDQRAGAPSVTYTGTTRLMSKPALKERQRQIIAKRTPPTKSYRNYVAAGVALVLAVCVGLVVWRRAQ